MDDLLDMLTIDDLSDKERSLVEVIGMRAYRAMVREYGGSDPVYIPKEETITLPVRNRLILKEYNGDNADKLAQKYRLTEQYVRTLVKDKTEQIRRRPLDGQMSFWDQDSG